MLQRASKLLLQYAFFRPESAIIVAITILCMGASALGVEWMPGAWWMWLGFGMVGEAAIVLSTLRDQKQLSRMVDALFRQQYDLTKIEGAELRKKVQKALEYRDLLVREIEREDNGVIDIQLSDVTRSMGDWISQVYRLAKSTDNYLRDTVIARDMASVPKELQQFYVLREQTSRQNVRVELDKTIEIKEQQWSALQKLRDAMAQAQLQLDHTLGAMGTVYMQAKLLGSNEAGSGRAQRLQADMREQVRALEDTQAAMEEVRQMVIRK
jgi:hypothetical protein